MKKEEKIMRKRKQRGNEEQLYKTYCGILSNLRTWRAGEETAFDFEMKTPAQKAMKERYALGAEAGYGGDFERALRLCRYLAPALAHRGDFGSAAEEEGVDAENAAALLDYSFGDPAHGIDCAAKAKILTACCLAFGIPARRVCLYPYSPYDEDTHVVCEIFDRKRKTWIMLDPSTGSYLTNGKKPLSVLEAREAFADMGAISAVFDKQRVRNLGNLIKRNRAMNAWYAKNLCYIGVETVSSDSRAEGAEEVYLVPENFDLAGRVQRHLEWTASEKKAPVLRIGTIAMWDPLA